jgi:hypothetical protein
LKRLGFQQPNELFSLASAFVKEIAFHNKPGTRTIRQIASVMHAWAQHVNLQSHRHWYDERITKVFPGGLEGIEVKRAKPEIWREFDNWLEQGDRNDPIVRADDYLLEIYKNRHNFNAACRYRTALMLMETLVEFWHISFESAVKSVRVIVANEPSSFLYKGDSVSLLQIERRIKNGNRQVEESAPKSTVLSFDFEA